MSVLSLRDKFLEDLLGAKHHAGNKGNVDDEDSMLNYNELQVQLSSSVTRALVCRIYENTEIISFGF